jgi:ADP-ribose pyrophosphatase YjhB (NUDIX family)
MKNQSTPEMAGVVVAVIVVHNKALLLTHGERGLWTLPGGIIFKGQTVQSTAENCVLTMTGIVAKVEASIFITENITPDTHDVIIVTLGRVPDEIADTDTGSLTHQWSLGSSKRVGPV